MLKIIGWFWLIIGIFGMAISIFNIIKISLDIYTIFYFIFSSLIVFYCYQYISSLKKRKELRKIELENILLQRKIELKKLQH